MWLELRLYQSRRMARLAQAVPLLRLTLDRRYARLFAKAPSVSLFRGAFRTFDEVRRSVPDPTRVGFDRVEATRMYDSRLDRVFLSDYPMLFWLGRLLRPGSSVFDLGGHVGLSYYAYERYLEFPEDLHWRVCDVPAVVEAGEALARERCARGLSFTQQFEDAAGADVLIASGSLQYIEEPLSRALGRLSRRPDHLLLNKVALCEGEPFVTLQGIGVAFCPYRVDNRQAFIEAMEQLGYNLVDAWKNGELSCRIPFDAVHSVDAYTGLYLRRRDLSAEYP